MTELRTNPRSTLENICAPGRFGLPTDTAGVRVFALENLQIASVIARRGVDEPLRERVREQFGLALESDARRFGVGNITALGIGPGRWLFIGDRVEREFADRVATAVSGLAAVANQSDGYAVFAVEGICARRALAKGAPLDLHPSAFAINRAAVTVIAHVGAILWRADEGSFRVAVFRSYARSFWLWLNASAAEFGLELLAQEPPR